MLYAIVMGVSLALLTVFGAVGKLATDDTDPVCNVKPWYTRIFSSDSDKIEIKDSNESPLKYYNVEIWNGTDAPITDSDIRFLWKNRLSWLKISNKYNPYHFNGPIRFELEKFFFDLLKIRGLYREYGILYHKDNYSAGKVREKYYNKIVSCFNSAMKSNVLILNKLDLYGFNLGKKLKKELIMLVWRTNQNMVLNHVVTKSDHNRLLDIPEILKS